MLPLCAVSSHIVKASEALPSKLARLGEGEARWTSTSTASSSLPDRQKKSVSDAIERAIARASKTLRNVRWFEVVETRGSVENGKVSQYQVTLKVGFTMED